VSRSHDFEILNFHSAVLSVGHRWVVLQQIILRSAEDCQLAFVISAIAIPDCAGVGLIFQNDDARRAIKKPRDMPMRFALRVALCRMLWSSTTLPYVAF
jgi:hypothetical protein